MPSQISSSLHRINRALKMRTLTFSCTFYCAPVDVICMYPFNEVANHLWFWGGSWSKPCLHFGLLLGHGISAPCFQSIFPSYSNSTPIKNNHTYMWFCWSSYLSLWMPFHMLGWDMVSCFSSEPAFRRDPSCDDAVFVALFRSLRWVTWNLHKCVYSKLQKQAQHFKCRPTGTPYQMLFGGIAVGVLYCMLARWLICTRYCKWGTLLQSVTWWHMYNIEHNATIHIRCGHVQ